MTGRRPSVHQQVLQSRTAAHQKEDPMDQYTFDSPKHDRKASLKKISSEKKTWIDKDMADFLGKPRSRTDSESSSSPTSKGGVARKQQTRKRADSRTRSGSSAKPTSRMTASTNYK
ncbi:hypothetical protein TeGR_g4733 [Tetraparma gracilis]|jgi:hypothetical protein|uniref:Uncharacterized protein n=1 Tax=Tetraparma gracilis TaxID=2962635 RepID=A0ABQ6MYK8_9STRA|nr:hypothetical protein TeGR_g4733 [Tetraparma gracilis]